MTEAAVTPTLLELPLGSVKVSHSPFVPAGKAFTARDGKPVWYGPLKDVYDGDEFDEIMLHADDIAEVKRCIAAPEPAA